MQNNYWSFFQLLEKTITVDTSLDDLKEYILPQLEVSHPNVIIQQDGGQSHWGINIPGFLRERFLDSWIGKYGSSRDITPMDIFSCGSM